MLIPVCCFSCGACIGHLWKQYNEYVNFYKENKDITSDNSEVTRRINNKNLPEPTPEELALITLGINRLCCRRMFLTHADTYNIMNLVK